LLALIGQIVTVTAKEEFSGSIQDGYSFPAAGTKKPCPMTAIIAGCPVEGDVLFNRFPLPAVYAAAIIQFHTLFCRTVND